MKRVDGRLPKEMRTITIERGVQKFADGSCLISFGNTKVICSASIETSVPPHAKSAGTGWVTGEYSMLPGCTSPRAGRETKGLKGRSHEIQRLIGRALRSVVDVAAMPERSIIVDCDVLQADGGTRTASITGGFVALALAIAKGQAEGKLSRERSILTGQVAAISVGLLGDQPLVDLCYQEDVKCDVDCNLVLTADQRIVEIQGTAEGRPATFKSWGEMVDMGSAAIMELIQIQTAALSQK